MTVTVIPVVIGALEMIFKCLRKSLEKLKIRGGIHSDNNIVEISQSPGRLKRFAFIQTPLRAHKIMIVWKNSQLENVGTKRKMQNM